LVSRPEASEYAVGKEVSESMSKLPRDELESIIERDAPGHTLASPPEGQEARSTRAEPEESSPDIAALREKYLGESAARDTAEEGAPSAGADQPDTGVSAEEPDDEIVPVQRTDAADPWDHESRPKTIVVSGKDKRIIGSQG
jgi:hypothetical protein